jgi:two-component system nitrate/nitrite response regulator NarL
MVKTTICLAGGAASKRETLGRGLAAGGFDIVGSFPDAGACADAAGSFDEPEMILMLAPERGAIGEADVLGVKRMYPEASAVILDGSATRAELTAFIEAGLNGYLPATIETNALAQSLHVILLGEQLYVTGTKAAAAQPSRSDRRASPRKRTIKRASILIDGRPEVMNGMVLDMSETGAKIRPANMAQLPSRFELRCGFGRTYRCEIVRRSAFYLGVQFVDATTVA